MKRIILIFLTVAILSLAANPRDVKPARGFRSLGIMRNLFSPG
jgi:hypothetical protein